MRAIQCEPPGSVRWLWQSTIPGTIVVPPASIDPHVAAIVDRAFVSSLGLIQADDAVLRRGC